MILVDAYADPGDGTEMLRVFCTDCKMLARVPRTGDADEAEARKLLSTVCTHVTETTE
jgi:hypothetical protein